MLGVSPDRVIVPSVPPHIVGSVWLVVKVGNGFTVTSAWSVETHPARFAVTVYVTVPTAGVKEVPSVTPLSQLILAPSGFVWKK